MPNGKEGEMEKWIALMELIVSTWPLIKMLLDAITDPAAKKAAEVKVSAAWSAMLTDAMKA